jgi:hypothetical protein
MKSTLPARKWTAPIATKRRRQKNRTLHAPLRKSPGLRGFFIYINHLEKLILLLFRRIEKIYAWIESYLYDFYIFSIFSCQNCTEKKYLMLSGIPAQPGSPAIKYS